VILGPNGTPVYHNMPGNPTAPAASYPPPPNFDDGIPPNFEHLAADPAAGGGVKHDDEEGDESPDI